MRPVLFLALLTVSCLGFNSTILADEPTNPLLRKFSITVDPSALNPPTKWQVPGITPLIWIHDPVSTVAYSTTESKELQLKPGKYQFGTYTFSFFFTVSLTGMLEYDKSLDQCVQGRGAQKLTIICSHTQPYSQDPDY
ncbi:MAG: hypothetical protein MRJ96_04610 [Nitrospirales bacterium]|nr:hypothetical protein [Nitrospira sp.]MDR4500724.1 hypothetical protein [Nitrospirales bacterium]